MDYMKKKTPIKWFLFYAIQGLDAPISLSLDGDDAQVTDIIDITYPHYMNLINGVIKDSE